MRKPDKMSMKNIDGHLLLIWLIFVGAISFAFVVAWNEGFLWLLFQGDRSHISIAIALLFILASVHSAIRIAQLSRQISLADHIAALLVGNPAIRLVDNRIIIGEQTPLPQSDISAYISDLLLTRRGEQSSEEVVASRSDLLDVFANKIRSPHEVGWFIVDMMIKLGLLGTIIGFIMMLATVGQTTSVDVSSMQKVLTQMSYGMGTALYTTFAGLTGSILLAAQYHLLDHGVDTLVEKTVTLIEVHILPALAEKT